MSTTPDLPPPDEPFLSVSRPRPPDEVVAAAHDLDWELREIANGKRKPGKLSMEQLAVVLTHARAARAGSVPADVFAALQGAVEFARGRGYVRTRQQEADDALRWLSSAPSTPPDEATSRDAVTVEIAEQVAVHVMHHIREMYPAALGAIPKNGATSIRNCIITQVRRFIDAARTQGDAA